MSNIVTATEENRKSIQEVPFSLLEEEFLVLDSILTKIQDRRFCIFDSMKRKKKIVILFFFLITEQQV